MLKYSPNAQKRIWGFLFASETTAPSRINYMETKNTEHSSSDIVIDVQDVTKIYRLYDRPIDRLKEAVSLTHRNYHRDFYALLNERGLTGLMRDVILELCGFHPDQEAKAAYASAFAAYSLYGWVEVWFRRGMRESAREMAELFRQQES